MKYDVFRYPDAEWNISGLFSHDDIILYFYDLMKECGIELPITVHGNIPCKWNSGRLIKGVSEDYQKKILEEYAKRGIKVLLTFSNYKVGEDDLSDRQSNNILSLAAQYSGNGAIIGSQLLTDYIHDRYPDFFLSTSILRAVHEHGKGNADYYNKLSQSMDMVVLHPDDGFNENVLDALTNKDKMEILINENCLLNCPNREEHCDIVSDYFNNNRNSNIMTQLQLFKKEHCKSIQNVSDLARFITAKQRICNMTIAEVDQLYLKGFRHFKIQGRSMSKPSFLYDVTRYMMNEICAAILFKTIMDKLSSIEENGNNAYQLTNGDWEKV